MRYRSALRYALTCLTICACLVSTRQAQAVETTEITIEQARQLAVYALRNGKPGQAIEVAKGLLQADPRDPVAYYVIAQAYAGLGQASLSRRAAGYAYRYSKEAPVRFRAGQLAAKMAYAEGKPSLAQFWLRRTAVYAPNEQAETLVARDYGALRRINPWSVRVRGDLRPSNNVNNGSDSALQVIDGVPVTGILSGAAQALSGVIGSLDVAGGYRLGQNKTSYTSLGARLYLQRVRLSSEAKALAPTANNSDYASTFSEVSVLHKFTVGPPDRGGTASVRVAVGESWAAGRRYYRFGKLSGDRQWTFAQGRTSFLLQGSIEGRAKARIPTSDAIILGLSGRISRKLGNGDSLSVSLALRGSNAKHHNGTSRVASLLTNYSFAKPIGPAKLSAGLVLGYTDYPVYRSGGFILVPGGRQDTSIYGDITLFFEDYDLAGFAPVLKVRAGRKSSNDSRFSTKDFSVSLSIQSKF